MYMVPTCIISRYVNRVYMAEDCGERDSGFFICAGWSQGMCALTAVLQRTDCDAGPAFSYFVRSGPAHDLGGVDEYLLRGV